MERECRVTANCSARKERKRAAEDEKSRGGKGTEDCGVAEGGGSVNGSEGDVLTQPSVSWG